MGGWLALGENYFLGEVFLDLKTIYTFLGVSRAVSCVQFESCTLTDISNQFLFWLLATHIGTLCPLIVHHQEQSTPRKQAKEKKFFQ